MDDQGKGGDLVKTALGILLLVVGSFMLIHWYPQIPQISLLKDGTVQMSPSAGDLSIYLAKYFKLLVISVLLLNAGGLMLFWGGSKKS